MPVAGATPGELGERRAQFANARRLAEQPVDLAAARSIAIGQLMTPAGEQDDGSAG